MDLRIVTADFYMTSPISGLDATYSEFRGSSIHQVPVIRIFGATKTGVKTCMHVHGVFPYIYIPYDGSDPVDSLVYQVATNLDKSINISLSRASSNQQHIYKIKHVSGIPFYGYHSKAHQFLKIYFYNPLILRKACSLLQNGSILGKNYQPHETHVPYVLQFMIDYNLHGMSFISTSKVSYRVETIANIDQNSAQSNNILKTSICAQEVDALSEHILNKLQLNEMAGNPGIAAIWEDEKQRRRLNEQDSLISQCISQERENIKPTASHLTMKALLADRLANTKEDKDCKPNQNNSVYPMETPDDKYILEASCIEHDTTDSSLTPSNMSMSILDDTVDIHNETINLDIDELNLMDILKDLGENREINEDDSILTQVVVENPESDEEELDMTLPLENFTTPDKSESTIVKSEENIEDLYHIPQLDGCNELKSKRLVRQKSFDVITKKNTAKDKSIAVRKLSIKYNLRNTKKCKNKPKNNTKKNTRKKSEKESINGNTFSLKKSKNKPEKSIVGNTNLEDQIIYSLRSRKIYNSDILNSKYHKQKLIKHAKEKRQIQKATVNAIQYENESLFIENNITSESDNKQKKLMINNCQSLLKFEDSMLAKTDTFKTRENRNSFKTNIKSRIENIGKSNNFLNCPDSEHTQNIHVSGEKSKSAKILSCKILGNEEKLDLDIFDFKNFIDVKKNSIFITKKRCNEVSSNYIEETIPNNKKTIFFNEKLNNIDNVATNYENSKYQWKENNFHPYWDSNDLINAKQSKNMDMKPILKKNWNINYSIEKTFKKLEKILYDSKQVISHGCISQHLLLKESKNLKREINSSITKKRVRFKDESFEVKYFVNEEYFDIPKLAKEDRYRQLRSISNTFFDGCNDSSSSEDEAKVKPKKRRSPKKKISQKYQPLQISYMQSPTKTINTKSQTKKMFSSNYYEPIPSTSKLDITVIEKIECKLVPTKRQKDEIMDIRDIKDKISDCVDLPDKVDDNINNIEEFTKEDYLCKGESDISKDFSKYEYISKGDEKFCLESMNASSESVETDITKNCNRVAHETLFDEDRNKIATFPEETTVIEDFSLRISSTDIEMLNCSALSLLENRTNILLEETKGSNKITQPNVIENQSLDDLTPISLDGIKSSSTENNIPILQDDDTLIASDESCYNMEDILEEVLDKTITQSEDQKCKSYLVDLTEYEKQFVKDPDDPNIWIPKFNPPTYEDVEKNMGDFGIPKTRYQEPFYSNVSDVTGNVEIGTEVLKICSKTVEDLPDFDSSFLGILDYRKEMCKNEEKSAKDLKAEVNSLILSHWGSDKCLISPVFVPPSKEEVVKWLESHSNQREKVEKTRREKKKISMPLSPGMEGNDENDMDITISLTPSTPASSLTSGKSSQSLKNTPSSITSKRSRRSLLAKLQETILNSSQEENSCNSQGVSNESKRSNVLNPSVLATSLHNSCEITGITMDKTFNFKMSLENLQNAKAVTEHQYLTTIVMEVHAQTRGDLKPDPAVDPIRAIFYSIVHDAPLESNISVEGIIVHDSQLDQNEKRVEYLAGCGIQTHEVAYAETEKSLIEKLVSVIKDSDPDILLGYEIEMLSWGYFMDRGYNLGYNMGQLISRVPDDNSLKYSDDENPHDLKIPGRIILNMWRLMRHEIALQSYSFENIIYHILHERVPLYSFKDLTLWWEHRTNLYRYKTFNFYVYKLRGMLKVLDQLDLIGRTSELARLFGIQFFEVLSRGSQFRVESMMLRLAKPLNYIPVSPSVQQRAAMKAPEYLPLILEPESKMYIDPVVVLDFQSLYPSMIIAYNYCFSTCLGKVKYLGQKDTFEFGATQLKVNPNRVRKFLKEDNLNFSPCGVAFVKSKIRRGILPRMLEEILNTRLMVKKSMKKHKHDKTLQRVLHSRQLGLKLIANVTYGYTAANFSGRMPSVEVGDSVVSKGRETLQRAIHLVENNADWRARVVYGDTDSLFVLIPGRTKEEAFKIGEEIATAVTNDNPQPVKLKMEKVYQPCILQTKKRYVGYMYESPDQEVPDFDAKGIETVRRDGCPAASKMLEKCIRLLFETKDVSKVRKYVERQFNKLLAGRISIQELTFAKEYRGASGYRPGACVPALELARKWSAVDKRSEPRSGERVPYVIVNGPPGLPLIRLVRSPYDLLKDPSLRPNAIYYATRVIIPCINRCFMLIGADLNNWFNALPRKHINYLPVTTPSKRSTISQYFSTISCAVCGAQTQDGLCNSCLSTPQISVITLQNKIVSWERSFYQTKMICQTCSGTSNDIKCISLDCPILYNLEQRKRDLQQVPFLMDLITNKFSF